MLNPNQLDENEAARMAAAHFGGNILGSLQTHYKLGTSPLTSLEEMQSKFIKGLSEIDITKLQPSKASDYQQILGEARDGSWGDREFIETLHVHCLRFTQGVPINREED